MMKIRPSFLSVFAMLMFLLSAFLQPNHPTAAQTSQYAIITPENVDQLELVATLGRGVPMDAAWSPDGAWFVVQTTTGVWLYPEDDLITPPRQIAHTQGTVRCFAFHPDSRHVATGHPDGMIYVWDIETNEMMASFASGQHELRRLVYSPDGTRLVSANDFRSPTDEDFVGVMLWDTLDQSLVAAISYENWSPGGVSFTPDSQELFVNFYYYSDAPRYRPLVVYDALSGEVLRSDVEIIPPMYVYSFVLSPDGRTVVFIGTTFYEVSAVALYLDTLTFAELPGDVQHIVQFLPDNHTVVYGNDHASVVVYDLNGGFRLAERSYPAEIAGLVIHPSRNLYTVIGADGLIYHEDLDEAFGLHVQHFNATQQQIHVGPDTIVSRQTGQAVIYNFDSYRVDAILNANWTAIGLSPDGRLLILAQENNLLLYDMIGHRWLRSVALPTNEEPNIYMVAVSPDGERFIVLDDEGITQWTIAGEPTGSYNPLPLSAVRYSSDGTTIAVAQDSTVCLWRGEFPFEGRPLGWSPPHPGTFALKVNRQMQSSCVELGTHPAFSSFAFTLDGTQLLVAGSEDTYPYASPSDIFLLSIGESGAIVSVRIIEPFPYHGDPIAAIALSGDVFATSGKDGNVNLWSLSQSLQLPAQGISQGNVPTIPPNRALRPAFDEPSPLLHTLPMEYGANDVQFSPDGTRLFVAGGDGTVRVWAVPSQ